MKSLMLWDNPMIVRGVRTRLRLPLLVSWGVVTIVASMFLYILVSGNAIKFDNVTPQEAARDAIPALLIMQGLILMVLGTGAVAGGMARERTYRLLDYQRLTPMTPSAKIVGLLLEGFAEAHQNGTMASLIIAGGSDEHITEYKARASSLGLSGVAHFIGRWPVAQLGELLAQADVLTAPRTRGVNTPQKIFPYMHSGKAVLLTRLPTHTQIVDDSVCMLADPTPRAFATAIDQLATDADLRARLGAAGRAFVERDHVYPAHRARVDRLYDHVESQLNSRPANRPDRERDTIPNGTAAETAR